MSISIVETLCFRTTHKQSTRNSKSEDVTPQAPLFLMVLTHRVLSIKFDMRRPECEREINDDVKYRVLSFEMNMEFRLVPKYRVFSIKIASKMSLPLQFFMVLKHCVSTVEMDLGRSECEREINLECKTQCFVYQNGHEELRGQTWCSNTVFCRLKWT